MMKLNLAPDENTYAVGEGTRQVYQKLEGGAGRFRRDYLGAAFKVDLQWTVDEGDYLYLQTFYRVTKEGVEPFLMDLILTEAALKPYECRIIPGTWRVTSVRGQQFIIKAQLEVYPGEFDDAYDAGLVTSYEAFAAEASLAFLDLRKLVNVTMPANLR